MGRRLGPKPHLHGEVTLCERCGRACDGRCRARELKDLERARDYRRMTPLL
jgi:hypothetical protein